MPDATPAVEEVSLKTLLKTYLELHRLRERLKDHEEYKSVLDPIFPGRGEDLKRRITQHEYEYGRQREYLENRYGCFRFAKVYNPIAREAMAEYMKSRYDYTTSEIVQERLGCAYCKNDFAHQPGLAEEAVDNWCTKFKDMPNMFTLECPAFEALKE